MFFSNMVRQVQGKVTVSIIACLVAYVARPGTNRTRKKNFNLKFFTEEQLIYNVVLISSVQQGDSILHLRILFCTLFRYGLSQDIEDSSLCYTAELRIQLFIHSLYNSLQWGGVDWEFGIFLFFSFCLFVFWLCCAACQPGIEPGHSIENTESKPLDHQGAPLPCTFELYT